MRTNKMFEHMTNKKRMGKNIQQIRARVTACMSSFENNLPTILNEMFTFSFASFEMLYQ